MQYIYILDSEILHLLLKQLLSSGKTNLYAVYEGKKLESKGKIWK